MMVDTTRYNLFCDLIAQLDIASELIQEYDTQLHDYKGTVLYQAESQLIKLLTSPWVWMGALRHFSSRMCRHFQKNNERMLAAHQKIKK